MLRFDEIEPELQILDLTRLSMRAAAPSTDQVRGHASFEMSQPAYPPPAHRQIWAARASGASQHQFRENQAGCSSALRTRSAVLRAPSLRIASARWLSNVLGLIFMRKAPCLLEQPSLIRPSTSRSRLVSGFWPDSEANITPGRRPRPAWLSRPCLRLGSEPNAGCLSDICFTATQTRSSC